MEIRQNMFVQTNFLREAVTHALGEISQERGKEGKKKKKQKQDMDGRTKDRVSKSRHQLFAAGLSSPAAGQESTYACMRCVDSAADDQKFRRISTLQSSAIRWALGCVNSPPRPGGPGGEIMQPRARLRADLGILTILVLSAVQSLQ